MLLCDLPDEILVHIYQFLPKSDLKSARQVCRRLLTTGSPLLVNKVYISLQKRNLDTFTEIAEHDLFQKTVSEVVFDDTFFDPGIQNSKMYEAGLRAQILERAGILGQPAEEDVTSAILAEGFRQYQKCCEDQTLYTWAAEQTGRLCAGLAQMRHVRTLTVTDTWTARSKTFAEVPIFRSKGPLSRSWDQLWLEPTSWSQTRHTPQGHPLITLLRAAFITSSHITTLAIDPKDYLRGITHRVFDMRPYDLNLSCSVFQHVRHITLYIDALDGVNEVLGLGGLAAILGSARRLERLTLGFDERLEGDVRFDLDDVIGNRTWEHLSTLSLQHIALHQYQLTRLLGQHATTLVVVELVDISFYTGSWSVIWPYLQNLSALKSLSLQQLVDEEREYDADACGRLQDMVTNRSEVFLGQG